jgi:beta-galactosidase
MASRTPEHGGTEYGWRFYSARPFLSGLFFWTGFDYRGEMNPFDWPAVSSQSGILDLCGFPKDIFYYLKSWWGKEPVLHVAPYWNRKNQEKQATRVTVYSNCEQVELLLNGGSLGRRDMPRNGHLEWSVNYQPGILAARGYSGTATVLEERVEPFGDPAAIHATADRDILRADGEDVSVVTIQVTDSSGVPVPDDSSTITFGIVGPGRIIGVGNGDPSSHEPDRYFETVRTSRIEGMRELAVTNLNDRPEVAAGYDDAAWKPALQSKRSDDWRAYTDSLIVIRGTFDLPGVTNATEVHLFTKSIVERQSVYVNGHLLAADIRRDAPDQSFRLEHSILRQGRNVYAVTGQRFRKKHQWDEPNTDPGLVQTIDPPHRWERRLFNGLAQLIVQSTKQPGELVLTASAKGLRQAAVTLRTRKVSSRPAVSAD